MFWVRHVKSVFLKGTQVKACFAKANVKGLMEVGSQQTVDYAGWYQYTLLFLKHRLL